MTTSVWAGRAVLLAVLAATACVHQGPIETLAVGDARCDVVAERGYINILDINALYDEVSNRRQRYERIADFAAANDVDVILLQETVGGVGMGTENSAGDLREMLREKHNLYYNLSTAWEIGETSIWTTANAILSRCEIKSSELVHLPFVVKAEKIIKLRRERPAKAQFVVSFTQNVQAVSIAIPGRGKINLYNTHLCARSDARGRARQMEAMLDYVERMEQKRLAGNPSVIGGDFNFDLFDNSGAEKFMWDRVTGAGFVDAYAHYQIAHSGGRETLETLCEDEDNPDEHCTVGVSDLNGHNARRVDYLFARKPSTILDSRVVFNPKVNRSQPTVSDHAGVLVRLELP